MLVVECSCMYFTCFVASSKLCFVEIKWNCSKITCLIWFANHRWKNYNLFKVKRNGEQWRMNGRVESFFFVVQDRLNCHIENYFKTTKLLKHLKTFAHVAIFGFCWILWHQKSFEVDTYSLKKCSHTISLISNTIRHKTVCKSNYYHRSVPFSIVRPISTTIRKLIYDALCFYRVENKKKCLKLIPVTGRYNIKSSFLMLHATCIIRCLRHCIQPT